METTPDAVVADGDGGWIIQGSRLGWRREWTEIRGGAGQKLGEIAVEGGERVDLPTGSST
jgi:hypothetical protein